MDYRLYMTGNLYREFQVYTHPECAYSNDLVRMLRASPSNIIQVRQITGDINPQYMSNVRDMLVETYESSMIFGDHMLDNLHISSMPVVVELLRPTVDNIVDHGVVSRTGGNDKKITQRVNIIGGYRETVSMLFPLVSQSIGPNATHRMILACFRSARCEFCTSKNVTDFLFDTLPSYVKSYGNALQIHHVSSLDVAAWSKYNKTSTVPMYVLIQPHRHGIQEHAIRSFEGGSASTLSELFTCIQLHLTNMSI